MIFRAEAQPIKAGAGNLVTRLLNFDVQPVGKCRHTPVVYAKDYDTPQGDHELWFAVCKECGRHTFGHPRREDAVAAWDNGDVYDGWLITEVEKSVRPYSSPARRRSKHWRRWNETDHYLQGRV